MFLRGLTTEEDSYNSRVGKLALRDSDNFTEVCFFFVVVVGQAGFHDKYVSLRIQEVWKICTVH